MPLLQNKTFVIQLTISC